MEQLSRLPQSPRSAQAKAERLLAQELKRRRLSPEQLARLGKAEPRKGAAAQRLKRETATTWDWIAQRLAMGVGPYAASCVRTLSKSDEYALLRD